MPPGGRELAERRRREDWLLARFARASFRNADLAAIRNDVHRGAAVEREDADCAVGLELG